MAVFKHHTAPVTSVEWHPTDATVFASAGADDQIALWDLALEKDDETTDQSAGDADAQLADLPPQLLFIHQVSFAWKHPFEMSIFFHVSHFALFGGGGESKQESS